MLALLHLCVKPRSVKHPTEPTTPGWAAPAYHLVCQLPRKKARAPCAHVTDKDTSEASPPTNYACIMLL